MDAIAAIRNRRSIRDYAETAVERGLVEAVIGDSTHAPWTPLALPDPWVFTVIEGAERIADYGARALAYAREHRPQARGYEWTERPDFSVFYNAPVLILISGRADYPLALEECTRAAQILTIAATARGLGSCWVGSPNLWLREPGVQKELGIPAGFVPQAAIVLGYPATVPAASRVFEPRINWA